jgi:hypothetical protein
VLLENVRIRGIDQRVLVGPAEEIARMAHEILIQRVVQGQEHRQCAATAAAGPPGLLPQAGDGAWIPYQNRSVQVPNVNAQLQG